MSHSKKLTIKRVIIGVVVLGAIALVPKAVIRTENGQSYAFVVSSEGVVDRRAVTTGGADGDLLEVLAGLRAGERVIVSPPPTLASGARVVALQR